MDNMVDGKGDLYWQTPDGNIVYLGEADLKDAFAKFDIPAERLTGKTFTMKVKFGKGEEEEKAVGFEEVLFSHYDDVRRQWLRMKFPLFVWN